MSADPFSGKHVLVVEDDAATREALVATLRRRGCTAAAGNGQEALDYLRCHPPPDLILLDLLMPVMDGYAFRRAQRSDPALASVPVVVLTAAESGEQAHGLGEVGYVQKPVDDEVLLGVVGRFLAPMPVEVLVVDDEEGVRKMLGLALRQHGFAVRLASGGPEAVALYRAHHETIAVVLLDVRMAGMDGPATLAALRQANPQVRCCFMSGDTGQYTVEELLALGASHVLQKPFSSLEQLSRQLREAAGIGRP
jgi:CheY-like chemotaxis protein